MLCKSFEELSHQQKVQFIGKLCHAAQSDEKLFHKSLDIIFEADYRGIFNNVKILPDNGKEENNSSGSNASAI
jgi:hypothetical protein